MPVLLERHVGEATYNLKYGRAVAHLHCELINTRVSNHAKCVALRVCSRVSRPNAEQILDHTELWACGTRGIASAPRAEASSALLTCCSSTNSRTPPSGLRASRTVNLFAASCIDVMSVKSDTVCLVSERIPWNSRATGESFHTTLAQSRLVCMIIKARKTTERISSVMGKISHGHRTVKHVSFCHDVPVAGCRSSSVPAVRIWLVILSAIDS